MLILYDNHDIILDAINVYTIEIIIGEKRVKDNINSITVLDRNKIDMIYLKMPCR